jgi:hypothetical protein
MPWQMLSITREGLASGHRNCSGDQILIAEAIDHLPYSRVCLVQPKMVINTYSIMQGLTCQYVRCIAQLKNIWPHLSAQKVSPAAAWHPWPSPCARHLPSSSTVSALEASSPVFDKARMDYQRLSNSQVHGQAMHRDTFTWLSSSRA